MFGSAFNQQVNLSLSYFCTSAQEINHNAPYNVSSPTFYFCFHRLRGASTELSKFQDVLHHFSNPIEYLMNLRLAHEGTGSDQFVLFVHMALADILIHVFAPELGNTCNTVSSVWIPEGRNINRSVLRCSNTYIDSTVPRP